MLHFEIMIMQYYQYQAQADKKMSSDKFLKFLMMISRPFLVSAEKKAEIGAPCFNTNCRKTCKSMAWEKCVKGLEEKGGSSTQSDESLQVSRM